MQIGSISAGMDTMSIQSIASQIAPRRQWRTIDQIARTSGGVFTRAAVCALVHRAKPHYDSKGNWVEGNGLASEISQPGGKGGKVLIDEIGFARWLERWTVQASDLAEGQGRATTVVMAAE